MTGFRTAPLWLVMASAACSTDFTPAASFAPQSCSVDDDCGDASAGLVCELTGTGAAAKPACVKATDAPLIIGESAPVSGTNQALGTEMKLGIELAFKEANTAGGVRGRQLQLDFRDDAYQPDLAEMAARSLLDVQTTKAMPRCPSTGTALTTDTTPISMTRLDRGPNAVLAILGDMGTPTTMRSAPVTIETGTVFFGAFTGASTLLRDDDVTAGPDCGKFIFNYRASYAQEAQATMEYFKHLGITNFHNMISFDQSDSFGQAGYDGMVAAYKNTNGSFPTTTDSTTPIYRVRYDRNDDTSVPAQVTMVEMHLADLLNAQSGPLTVGIMMTDTYGAATEFIQQLRTWQWAAPQQTTLQAATRLTLQFSNVSFVGANTLSDRLVALGKVPLSGNAAGFTDNVVISQVVPNYQDDTSDVVKAYNTLIANNDDKPSFVSLEGYIAARVFIAGLLIHTGPFTASSIVDSLEALPDLGLGLGATSGFQTPAGQSPNHQYSSTVWGTKLNSDGTFQNLYFWSVGIPIQFPE